MPSLVLRLSATNFPGSSACSLVFSVSREKWYFSPQSHGIGIAVTGVVVQVQRNLFPRTVPGVEELESCLKGLNFSLMLSYD